MEPFSLLTGVALLLVIISTVYLLRWDRNLFRWCSSFLYFPAPAKELICKLVRLIKRDTGSLTEEEDNFLRMFKLMSNIAPKAVRLKFDHHFPPVSLSTILATSKTKVENKLLKNKIINGKQMDLLYPSTGYTSSVNYEVTLMICLLRNLSTISPPSLGYDKLPRTTEISDAADLARIKYYRNIFAHPGKDELSNDEFDSMWACVSEAVCRLGGTGYKTKCDDLSQMNLNKDVLIHVRQNLTEFRSEWKIYQTDLGEVKHEQTILKEKAVYFEEGLTSVKTEQLSFKREITVRAADLQKDVDAVKIDHDTLKEQVTVQSSKIKEQLVSCSCEGIHKLVLKEWKDKEEKFVKTPSSEYVSNILRTENIVTVTGRPGIGKSATIHHVALSMQRGYLKYAVIPCKNPIDIVNHSKDGAYKIFVIDDVCGKYVINQYDVEEWTKYTEDIDKILKEGKTKLLATLRLQVFQETQFKRIKIFSKNVCDLSSKAFLLPSKIKLEIAKAYLPENVVMEIGQSLESYEYLPLLCLLYSKNSNTNALKYFENPFLMYKQELDEMHVQKDKTKLCALFLLVVFDGCIFERIIRDEKFRQTLELIFESCNVVNGTPTVVIHELNTLLGTYLEKKDGVEPNSLAYHAVHDKMFDFLCCYFGGKFQKCMLKFSDDDIICSRMHLKSLRLPENHEAFEIMIEKDNEHDYFDKIVDMLRKGKIYDIVCNRQMQYEVYRSKLISHLQLLTSDKIKTLLHAHDKNGKTLTYLVCLKGYTDLVHFILERTDDINADHLSKYPPLVGACERGDDIIVQLLISKGVNVNKSDVSNQSPLIIALKCCHSADIHDDGSTIKSHSLIIDLLIENGALMDNLKEFYKFLFIQKNVSPLIGASSLGKLSMVKNFIQKGDNLYDTDTRDFTPLHWAIYNGHHITAKYLIDVGSNLHVIEQDGRNAFMLACYSGCTEIVKYLLSKGFDVNQVNASGWTPLLYAINGMGEAGNSVITVTFLISQGANELFRNKDGVSPLMLSCKHGSYKIAESILGKHRNMDINEADMNGITALMYAGIHGHNDICNLLISKRANIHAVDKFEWTCLMWACFMGYESTAELFISAGSEINKKDIHGNTALLLASQYGNTKMLCLLMSKGANASAVNNNGSTAIILALKNGRISIANFLITKGAFVTEKDIVKTSDTILSVDNDHITASALHPTDKNINTALKVAAVEGNTETANLLLRKGIDVNVIDNDSSTALLLAIMGGYSETVDLLLTKGADVNPADKDGNTALIFAAVHSHTDTVDLIIANGADINAANNDGKTALISATRVGHTDTADLLLTKGADVNAADKDGNTAFLLAAERGHTETVDLLLSKGADVNAAEKFGKTAFVLAAMYGHTETVDLLLTKVGDLIAADKDGNTAFLLAAMRGRTKIVDLLLTKGADVNASDKDGRTALIVAEHCLHEDIEFLIISKGAHVNAALKAVITADLIATAQKYGHEDIVDLIIAKGAYINTADKVGDTSLLLAARSGKTETVDLRFTKGADVYAADKYGRTAILLSAMYGHTETVDLLLTKGADVNAADKYGNTAFVLAAMRDHADTVDFLLTKVANLNAADEDGNTAFLLAALRGNTKTVDLLLTKGADVNAADKDGTTAFVLAAMRGHTETVDVLLTKGADVNATDERGRTALILAAMNVHTVTVDLLLTKGADVNAADEDGNTAFLLAALRGHTKTVDLLLTKGADVNAACKDGYTSLLIAAGLGHTETVDLLLTKGADVNAACKDGYTSLLIAAGLGHTETVDLLLTKGADVNAADKLGITALILAAKHGHT